MKLPPELVSVYKKFNGGEIDGDRIIFTTAAGEKYELKGFHPMVYHRGYPDPLVEGMYQLLVVKYKTIPVDYIPFAMGMSPLGVRYCINVNNQKIYADNSCNENVPRQTMNFVCDSIYEFIDGMKKPQPGEPTIRDLLKPKKRDPATRRKINTKAKFKFIESSKQLSDADFEFVEQKIGVKLPPDLVSVYRKYNGGVISGNRNVFVSMDEDETSYELQLFHPMRYSRFGDELLEEEYEFYVVNRKLIPFNYIPFANDSGGMQYCINIDNQKIYFYNAETAYVDPDYKIQLVCNSIYEFINGMMTEDEVEAYRSQN
jgi:cell wall assembly regulator SMI1